MFKWIKRKWKDRKKCPVETIHGRLTQAQILALLEGEHVYEEIADPNVSDGHRNRLSSKLHRPISMQRSVSFQDVSFLESKRVARNGHSVRSCAFNSADILPSVSCASISSSLANTPTNSVGNLTDRDVCLQLLPETFSDINSHCSRTKRDQTFRALPLHSNVYLPRKSATFASADSEINRKRVKFQNTKDFNETDILYSTTGSDSGYGFSNNNSTGSEEGDIPVKGNYDAYISKMEQLLRLEKEVRNILKSIRGDDEPDDGYQNSRYFQNNSSFDMEPATFQATRTNSRKLQPKDSTESVDTAKATSTSTQHLPLRRVSDKSISPRVSQKSFNSRGNGVPPRAQSPLPPTPDCSQVTTSLWNQPIRNISVTPTPERIPLNSPDSYLAPQYFNNNKTGRNMTDCFHQSQRCLSPSKRCRTPINDACLTEIPNVRSTPHITNKVKAPNILEQCNRVASVPLNGTLSRATGKIVSKEVVCLECSKHRSNSPHFRKKQLAPLPPNMSRDCNNNNTSQCDGTNCIFTDMFGLSQGDSRCNQQYTPLLKH